MIVTQTGDKKSTDGHRYPDKLLIEKGILAEAAHSRSTNEGYGKYRAEENPVDVCKRRGPFEYGALQCGDHCLDAAVGSTRGIISIRPTVAANGRGQVKLIGALSPGASWGRAVPDAAKAFPAGSKSTVTNEMFRIISSEELRATASIRGALSNVLTLWLLILIFSAGLSLSFHIKDASVSSKYVCTTWRSPVYMPVSRTGVIPPGIINVSPSRSARSTLPLS